MAIRRSKMVGSGITEENAESLELDPRDPGDAQLMKEWLESIPERLNQPWGSHGVVIAAARARLQEITDELKHLERYSPEYSAQFQERSSEAWYVRDIVKTARAVELAVEGRRPWEAVSRAMQIGELLAEFRLKFAWESDALWGRKRRNEQRAEAQSRRKQPADDRVRMVDELHAKGLSKRRAIDLTAAHFRIHPSTVRKDYYKK